MELHIYTSAKHKTELGNRVEIQTKTFKSP